jgi:alanyl-tRNA synthetase
VGKSVEDLIADPNGPAAFENSVEFCGGTHLLNSGHIERFLITDEDAIAKGIRRIIAITGGEALKASKKAAELEKDVADLSKEIGEAGAAEQRNFVKRINVLSDEVNQAQISCVAKDAIRNSLKSLKKTLDDLDKKEKAQLLAKAMDETKELIQKIKSETPELKFIVREFNVNGDPKSLNNIITQFKTALPSTCCMFFSVDPVASKILCLSSVPDVSANFLKFFLNIFFNLEIFL